MTWPNNADGDVFRRLTAHHFDFAKEYDVDFDVDFETWPPPAEAVELLESNYPNLKLIEPDAEDLAKGETHGYVNFEIRSRVTYEFVISIQCEVSKLMEAYGGCCECWGVSQD